MTSDSGSGPAGTGLGRLVVADAEPWDVTAVVPAYQRADFVGRAVLSALAQRPRPPAEVIVVDDGSTDGTGDVAEALGARVIRQPNAGEGAARNAALRAAGTRWVALLDSDDEWLPGHLATLMPHAVDAVLVAAMARGVPSGRLVGAPWSSIRRVGPRDVIWPQSPFSPCGVVLDRERTLGVGGFPTFRLGADLDLWIRLLATGHGVVLPDVTSVYTEHAGQVSLDQAEMRVTRREVVGRHRDEPWFDPRVESRMAAVERWDEFRQSGPSGRVVAARSLATTLARDRNAWRGVLDTVRWRLTGRMR